MIERIDYDERVQHFLRMHPDAGEARLFIEFLARGRMPGQAAVSTDDLGSGIATLEESGRLIWWHYEGERQEVLVIDGVEYDD